MRIEILRDEGHGAETTSLMTSINKELLIIIVINYFQIISVKLILVRK